MGEVGLKGDSRKTRNPNPHDNARSQLEGF